MNYFISEKDQNGYVYSIDNLILDYTLNHPSTDIISFIHDLIKKYPEYEKEYYELLNKPYSSHWQFYNNKVHICNGCTVWFGKWTVNNEGDKTIFPVFRIEFNPNKHMDKPIIIDLLTWIYQNMGDSELRKYDMAIDIKCKLQDVQVIGSRKEKGLYKGTRYYGQRNQDGYCKIYDKGTEQDLDEDLTRIEHTLVHQRKDSHHKKKGINLENVYIKTYTEEKIILKSKPMQAIYELCVRCAANNIEFDDIVSDLGRREQKIIKDAISGGSYKKLDIDIDIHNRLIDEVYRIFKINKLHKPLLEDINGFISLPDDFNGLPFE